MDNLISIEDFAKKLNKPKSTVYSWKQKGDIPSFVFLKIGGCIFVKQNKFDEWVENSSIES